MNGILTLHRCEHMYNRCSGGVGGEDALTPFLFRVLRRLLWKGWGLQQVRHPPSLEFQ